MVISVWLKAFRLRTLPLALSSIAMGGILAIGKGSFRWDIFVFCVLTTVFLQILSNLSNDFGDSIHGADSTDRKGPSRAVQSGAITPAAMKKAMALFVLLSLVSGISLLFLAFGVNWTAILFFFGLGILSIGAAVAYTVGKKPYGYAGLGDLSVFIFFGLVGVLGSLYLFNGAFEWADFLPAVTCGMFSVAVLNVNNIRDIDSDFKAGKYSVPVRLGRKKAAIYHWFLLLGGMAAAGAHAALNYSSPWQWLFLLTLPLLIRNGMAVSVRKNEELDPFLKQMAMSTLLFVVLYGTGYLLR